MNVFLAELRQVIIPDRDGQHGPLPPLLVTMTVVTGLVDAFSYLVLGHVFVANMTGNVVFLAFALAGGGGTKSGRRLVSVAAMLVGALIGALFVLHAQTVWPLVIALVAVAAIAATAEVSARSDSAWARG
jgi:uncharacterized membrane protein YoaK (UPF0700 family)